MVKKSVSKAINNVSKKLNNVSKQLKSVFDTQNILSSVIVILLIVYMSFVNVSNVPRLFNNVIVKLVLLGLVAYTFVQDKLVAVFLAITIILSISLASKHKVFKSDILVNDEEYENETPSQELPSVMEESLEPLSNNLQISSSNNPSNSYLSSGPSGVPSGGLNISTHSRV